ncbi:MAG TPA: hypothetical protein PLQ88_16425, partial [Blastocatellia bacterium]|nr:hypothetical protein [Blastocatellia bacterium]
REAEKAFGNGALLLEVFIERARHVEIQILGDQHGNLVHLFERDCSLQRRHQKVIEESPSPALNAELRAGMGEAAINIARAIGYANAGTVEFILSPTGEFYFIEANTRLQVEHPVTEMITGLDLVRLQIEIAEGKPLPFSQADLKTAGHAVEARLYAEDPANSFLPVTGKILDWRLPQGINGLRVDAGIETGMEVGIHYDPMLAKLIAYAEDRDTAVRKLSYALGQTVVLGFQTNRDFLIRLLEHETFRQGAADISFLTERLDELVGNNNPQLEQASAMAAALYLQQQQQQSNSLLAEIPPGYRNNPYRAPSIKLLLGNQEAEVFCRHLVGNRFEVTALGTTAGVEVLHAEARQLRLAIDGVQRTFCITEANDHLFIDSPLGASIIKRLPRHPLPSATGQEGTASSPMPGVVLKILVSEGRRVTAGETLLILEAMKMEQTIRANSDGVVTAIKVSVGQVVSPGDALVQIECDTQT